MTFLIPDPAELRARAGRIASVAHATRAHADRLAAAVAATGWHGPAARVFAGQAELALGGLRTAAGRLDDAADLLRGHADRVDDLLQMALTLVRLGVGTLTDVLARSADLLLPLGADLGAGLDAELGNIASLAGGAVSTVGEMVGDVAGTTLDGLGLG